MSKEKHKQKKDQKKKTAKRGQTAYAIITNLVGDNALGVVGNIILTMTCNVGLLHHLKKLKN